MIELLEKNKIEELVRYTSDNLEEFLNGQGGKELMGKLIKNLERTLKI